MNTFGYKRDPMQKTGSDGAVSDWWAKDKDVSELLASVPQLSAGDIDLRPYCTETNQYALSACAGNATADAVEIVTNVDETLAAKLEDRTPDPCPQLSRLFVYAMARTLDGSLAADQGTFIRSCFEVLSRFGVPEETVWPYDDSKVFVSPSMIAQRSALGHKIHSYYRIKSTGQDRLDEVVSALRAMKPVVFGTLIEESFRSVGSLAPVGPPKGTTIGGHAMIIVGFIGGNFLVKNSWGKGWGDKGYFLMSPEYLAWEETWDLWVPTGAFGLALVELLPRL